MAYLATATPQQLHGHGTGDDGPGDEALWLFRGFVPADQVRVHGRALVTAYRCRCLWTHFPASLHSDAGTRAAECPWHPGSGVVRTYLTGCGKPRSLTFSVRLGALAAAAPMSSRMHQPMGPVRNSGSAATPGSCYRRWQTTTLLRVRSRCA